MEATKKIKKTLEEFKRVREKSTRRKKQKVII